MFSLLPHSGQTRIPFDPNSVCHSAPHFGQMLSLPDFSFGNIKSEPLPICLHPAQRIFAFAILVSLPTVAARLLPQRGHFSFIVIFSILLGIMNVMCRRRRSECRWRLQKLPWCRPKPFGRRNSELLRRSWEFPCC